jgi:carbonic anhydrase/acetyltransferase-like protein (isoleucine patch superfamily)
MFFTYREHSPRIADDAFVAETATVIGDVEIGAGSSVWFGVIIRGDNAPIRIGARTNIQDGTIIHVDADAPATIGDEVVIGHGAIVHGATVADRAQVGMGAIVLSHAMVGPGAIVGAGALVPEGKLVEAGTVVMGVPAKPVRATTERDAAGILATAEHYVGRGREFREGAARATAPDMRPAE